MNRLILRRYRVRQSKEKDTEGEEGGKKVGGKKKKV